MTRLYALVDETDEEFIGIEVGDFSDMSHLATNYIEATGHDLSVHRIESSRSWTYKPPRADDER